MEKIQFNNNLFYWALIFIVCTILLKTICITIFFNQLIDIPEIIVESVEITVESVLLFLIIKKHKYARIGIILWISMFLITLPVYKSIKLLGLSLIFGFDIPAFQFYIEQIINIIIGIVLLYFTLKTTTVSPEIIKI
jgi:hypothetical protein